MIDIHCHLIHGLDDGASSMEESLKMVREAEKAGVKVLFATPHYHEKVFRFDRVIEKYNEICEKASDYNVSIKLGAEVYFEPRLCKTLHENSIVMLNRSRYFLLELPLYMIPEYSFELIYRLKVKNMIPVLAHPERNRNFIRNMNQLVAYVEAGCLIQLDSGSITGAYGISISEFAKQLIKLKLAHFVASDAHSANDYANWYRKSYNKVRRWAGEDYSDKLFFSNAALILRDVEQNIYQMI